MDEKERLPPRLSSGDVQLLRAAAGDLPDGIVTLTADIVTRIQEDLAARRAEIAAAFPDLVHACPYNMRLAVTAWVFAAIVAHARDRGTFRFLIYDRLGFGPDAYLPLYDAGGMDISNDFDLTGTAS